MHRLRLLGWTEGRLAPMWPPPGWPWEGGGTPLLEELLEAAFYKWLRALRASSLKSPFPPPATGRQWHLGTKIATCHPPTSSGKGRGRPSLAGPGARGRLVCPPCLGPGIPRIPPTRLGARGGGRWAPLLASAGRGPGSRVREGPQ